MVVLVFERLLVGYAHDWPRLAPQAHLSGFARKAVILGNITTPEPLKACRPSQHRRYRRRSGVYIDREFGHVSDSFCRAESIIHKDQIYNVDCIWQAVHPVSRVLIACGTEGYRSTASLVTALVYLESVEHPEASKQLRKLFDL